MMDANRAASDDSRLWDLVARDWIAGRAITATARPAAQVCL